MCQFTRVDVYQYIGKTGLAGKREERHGGMRDSTIFYRSFYDAIKELPAEQQVNCFHAIMDYALDGKEPEGNGIERTVFTLVRPQIDTNNQRYENGTKGGRPREKAEQRQETAEQRPRENQTRTKSEPKGNQIETKPEPENNQEETSPEPKENQGETEAEPKENQEKTKPEPGNNQTETKLEPNVNDNDNVNDNGNVNDNDKTERKDLRVCAHAREEGHTEVVTGIPDSGKPPRQGDKKQEPGTRFPDFWKFYPKQVERQMAYQEYLSLLNHTQGLDEDKLIQAARNYAEVCQIRGTAERFIKHPANWLADGTWMDYMPTVYRRPEAEGKPWQQGNNRFLAFPQREYGRTDYQTLEQRLLKNQAGDG